MGADNAPSLREIAAGAGLGALLGGVLLAPGLEEGVRPHPGANEIYKGGDVVINIKTAVGRTSNVVPDKNAAPNNIDEASLSINGQSLAGVERIRIHNPRILETEVLQTKQNPDGKVITIIIPFDDGQELYYRYGDGSIQFAGHGNFVKGTDQPDGSFQTTDGHVIPDANVSTVEVLPNPPTQPTNP